MREILKGLKGKSSTKGMHGIKNNRMLVKLVKKMHADEKSAIQFVQPSTLKTTGTDQSDELESSSCLRKPKECDIDEDPSSYNPPFYLGRTSVVGSFHKYRS